jgi:hypothetical protein
MYLAGGLKNRVPRIKLVGLVVNVDLAEVFDEIGYLIVVVLPDLVEAKVLG